MTRSSLKPAPYLSLRHARIGRVDGQGRLPPGWRGEQLSAIEVLEVEFVDERPALSVRLEWGETAGGWCALALAPYLAAPSNSVVLLAGQVTLADWEGVGEAVLSLREWRHGGELVRQPTRPLQLAGEPQIGALGLEVVEDSRVVQPLFMIRPEPSGAGFLTTTLAGMAFGLLEENPRWLWG